MLPTSRQKFFRQIQSIGNQESILEEKHNFHFQKLQQQKMSEISKMLRNSKSQIEFYGLRDLNARPKSPKREIDKRLFSLPDSQQQNDPELLRQSVQCSKCSVSLSKITIQKTQSQETFKLSSPCFECFEKSDQQMKPQLQLQPHLALKRKNLPPLLVQAHFSEPPGYEFIRGQPPAKEITCLKGKKVNGRLKEGLNQDFLIFLEKQRLLQQSSLKPLNTNWKKNMNLKKVNYIYIQKQVNLYVSKTGGSILGKAFSKIKTQNSQNTEQNEIERQIMRQKEKQIDELIFGNKKQTSLADEFMDMKDFL